DCDFAVVGNFLGLASGYYRSADAHRETSPVLVTEPEVDRLAGAHEPHRAAQAAILESIAHAMLFALHSLHCTDKCPRGRSGPWRGLTLAPTALPSFSINTMVAVAAIRRMSADP